MTRRGRRTFAAVVLVAVAAAVVAFGPPLPGPNVRKLLGLKDDRPLAGDCTPAPRLTRTPAHPRPSPGIWRAEAPSPVRRSEVKAAELGGRIYIVGGQGRGGRSLATVVAFDPATGHYTRMPDMPARVDHPLVVTHAGSLYVIGGYVDSEPTGRAWRYTPGRGWTALPALRTPRGGLGGGVIGDRLYAVAGAPRTFPEYRAKPYSSLEVFDFKTGRWSSGPPIPTARHHVGAAVAGRKLYVAGGRTPSDFSSSAFERFDPVAGRWQKLPPLPAGAGGLSLVNSHAVLVAIGGDDEERLPAGGGWVTGAVWAFHVRSERWTRLPDLRTPVHAEAAAVARGRIHVFEGAPCPGFGRTSGAQWLAAP